MLFLSSQISMASQAPWWLILDDFLTPKASRKKANGAKMGPEGSQITPKSTQSELSKTLKVSS